MVTVGSAAKGRQGGYNGGGLGGVGAGAGGGGGATDIRRSPYGLVDRVLIAGGGGGRGSSHVASGGDGGVEAMRFVHHTSAQ